MPDPPTTVTSPRGSGGPVLPPPPPPPEGRPRLKKLRLLLIFTGLAALAVVSTVFGMMMAVASDLPQLENRAEFNRAQNSTVYADPQAGREELATLTGNENRILLEEDEISPNIMNAVIAVEDERFYDHEGVDYRGIARAFVQDVLSRSASQGGSTITQQFVKNALAAQTERTVFQKLREAALAYHLERQWSKQKILTQYLNTVYFGNGAYGVEAAVRAYFGGDEQAIDPATGLPIAETDGGFIGEDEDAQASNVAPEEAALLAGMIASPSLYDPVQSPQQARARRNLVLQKMLEQDMIARDDYERAIRQALPSANEIRPPQPHSTQPYFTTWLTQQLVDRYGAGAVFGGGLEITTTLDPELQAAAEQAIAGRLTGVGPSASLVAIENGTGEIKAMVGGPDFEERPFNLATYGHRQPGSAFKPFTLVRALADGISPTATFASQRKIFPVPGSKREKFVVNNYEDSYLGVADLYSATTYSDNSVYAELGVDVVGTKRIAAMANRIGIETEISTNPAMTLGGLEQGLTPLELAFAYSTIANEGERVSGSLASSPGGPVGVQSVRGKGIDARNRRESERVYPESVGETVRSMLGNVVASGTATAAQIGEFAGGKTGTTDSYGDAWFVGFNDELTVAVWVGYPDELIPMETEYYGSPVAGGTFPAEIWHDLMVAWIEIRERRELERELERAEREGDDGEVAAPESTDYAPEVEPAEPSTPVPEDEGAAAAPDGARGDAGTGGGAPDAAPAPEATPAPEPAPEPEPAPPAEPVEPAPGSGGGGGGAAAPE